MGSFVSATFDENMKKNQQFMLDMNQITIERQIQMQNQMRERMVAMQIAQARELLNWYGSFYAVASTAMIAGFRRSRKPGLLVPLLPLTFVLGYQADLAYGNKIHRIRGEAENIMVREKELLHLPLNLPTMSSIDMARQAQRDSLKLHAAQPPTFH